MILREIDASYMRTVNSIIRNGIRMEGSKRTKWEDGTTAYTVADKSTVVNVYTMNDDYSVDLPEYRRLNWLNCIDEILWIWVKKSNKVSDLASKIWDAWAFGDGTIGKAYGYQLAKEHEFPEGKMNQVDWIIHQLKNNPYSRRMVVNMFNHEDLKDMGLQPCAHSITLTAIGDRLHMILNQRSQDMFVANQWNVFQYSVLLQMFSRISGFKPGTLTHVIANAHIYDRHLAIIENNVTECGFVPDGRSEPAVYKIQVGEVKDFNKYEIGDFKYVGDDYNKIKPIKNIPVAI